MQANIWDAMQHIARLDLAKDDPEGEPPDDFGFFHPADVVIDAWMARKAHHVLPEPGGWLDQTLAWRHDLTLCDVLYNAAVARVRDGSPEAILNAMDDMPRVRMFGD